MRFIRRYRIPAVFCAFAVLLCALISRPYVNMGVCDDGPYVMMAQHVAATGHIVYNGWASTMLGLQLYLAAALIKLFGFSFTTVRMSTLLVSVVLAYLLQRILVLSGVSEFNACVATLALVLSPLYLMVSVAFMTDINGLFAVLLCLYGCLRALQSATQKAAIGWLCFAVVTNVVVGTSRQIAWLGVLLMVPCALWLLRAQRRVLIAGAGACLLGALSIFACLQWLKLQPYSIPEHLLPDAFPVLYATKNLLQFAYEIPFLLLPVVALFLPELRKSRPWMKIGIFVLALGYLLLAIHKGHLPLLEPAMTGGGNWIGIHGIPEGNHLHGDPPLFLDPQIRLLFTIATLGGVAGLISSLLPRQRSTPALPSPANISWSQLNVLLIPFTVAYAMLLLPRAANGWFFDRYALGLLIVALIYLPRYYQEQVKPRFSLGALLLVAAMAVYAVSATHNMFSLYRSRVELATELQAIGIPDTSVDNGWERNFEVEIEHAGYLNNEKIELPASAYTPAPPLPPGTCPMFLSAVTPYVHPLYGISFDPNACYGPAPFAPVHYSRWPYLKPGTLYVVRYTAPTDQAKLSLR